MSDQLPLVFDEDRAAFVSALTGTQRYETSPGGGETLKRRGMEVAEANVDPAWIHRADEAISGLAASGRPFTAEDVCRLAGRPDRPNAVGARLSAWARKGAIRSSGYRRADRDEAHARIIAVWEGA